MKQATRELAEITAAKLAAGADAVATIQFALLEAQAIILADTMQKLSNPPRTVKYDA